MKPIEQTIEMILRLRAGAPGIALQLGVARYFGTPREAAPAVVTLPEDAEAAERLLKWARAKNAQERGQVWIRPDPSAQHPWLLLDDLNSATAEGVASEAAALVVETSPGNCQLRIRSARSLTLAERAVAQSVLVQRYDADPGSIAGDKWGRLAGFRGWKTQPGCWTNLAGWSAAGVPPLDPEPLLAAGSLPPRGGRTQPFAPAPGAAPSMGPSLSASLAQLDDRGGAALTRHQRHFRAACRALRRGLRDTEIVEQLMAMAREDGKRERETAARRYAQTVLAGARRAVHGG